MTFKLLILKPGAHWLRLKPASKLLITRSLQAFVTRALDKNSQARANYSGTLQ